MKTMRMMGVLGVMPVVILLLKWFSGYWFFAVGVTVFFGLICFSIWRRSRPLAFFCQNCSQKIEVPPGMAGTKIGCPTCQQEIMVPAPVEPSPRKSSVRSWGQLIQGFGVAAILVSLFSGAMTFNGISESSYGSEKTRLGWALNYNFEGHCFWFGVALMVLAQLYFIRAGVERMANSR